MLSFPHALRWRMAHNHELASLVADIKRRVVQLVEKLGLGPDDDDDWDAQQLLLGMGELYAEGVFHKGRSP